MAGAVVAIRTSTTGEGELPSPTTEEPVPIWFDYSRRLIGFGEILMPPGDYEADLVKLKAYFRREMARRPENY